MKLKTILILIFLILTALVIAYIDYGIHHFGLRFYSGKDGGYSIRFESIVILSTSFFLLSTISRGRKFSEYMLAVLAGFITGIVVGTGCYLLPFDNGLAYHILSVVVCFSCFFGFRKIYRKTTKKASAE